MRDIAHFKSGL